MNNKMNEMLQKYLREAKSDSEKDMEEVIQKFMEDYNSGKLDDIENTPLDDAYELLDKAQYAKTEKQAKKLAQQAYDICNECFDAILFLVDLEKDLLKREQMLEEGLNKEKERLEKEGFFKKDCIGNFYQIFETRPYMRGLNYKAHEYANLGKLKLSKEVCLEILKLNESDNTGARYLLMVIYAMLEEEKELLKLANKYNEENLEVLFPVMVLYYKQNNSVKAVEYLNRIKKVNKDFVNVIKGKATPNPNVPEGAYMLGDASEVVMYFSEYAFFVMQNPGIIDFILKQK